MKAIFAHKQTFSRKGNSRNRSIADICAEAARLDGASPHVKDPIPPEVIFGINPSEVPGKIEEMVRAQNAILRKRRKAEPWIASDLRGIRKDTHLLVGYVFSYPLAKGDFESSADFENYERWVRDVMKFAHSDADENALEVLSIVEHFDESYPHIHVHAVPVVTDQNPRMNAKKCHEGFVAQDLHTAKNKSGSPSRSYKRAMSEWQDKYHAEVGQRHAQARMGPGRRRLTRAAYKIEQDFLAKMQEAAIVEDEIQQEREMLSAEQEQVEKQAARRAADLEEHRLQIENDRASMISETTKDRQIILDAVRDQRHALIAQEQSAKAREQELEEKIEALEREKASFQAELKAASLSAAKEASLFTAEIITSVITGDARLHKNGKISLGDQSLRSRGEKLSQLIGGLSMIKEAIHAVEQVWTNLTSRLSDKEIKSRTEQASLGLRRVREKVQSSIKPR